MAYTLGGATTDDVSISSPNSYVGSGLSWFYAGWVNASTLTVGRSLFGAAGTQLALSIAASGELAVNFKFSTTNGVMTTSGAGLTTGVWYFVAVLGIQSTTGPAMDARVWIGTNEIAPANISLSTTTSPVGASTNNVVGTIGNSGPAASVAFQGDVDAVYMAGTAASGSSTAKTSHLFFLDSTTAISTEAADLMLARVVLPIWRGEGTDAWFSPAAPGQWRAIISMGQNEPARQQGQGAAVIAAYATPAFNATFSQARCPRHNYGHRAGFMPSRRR